MKKLILLIAVLVVITIPAVIYCFNYFTIIKPVKEKLNSDVRNEGIKIDVHYKNYTQSKTLTFNLEEVKDEKAPIDVFRVLLHTANALKDKSFDKVELSFRNNLKFILKGDYFQKLGEEFGDQNPMYTLRTMPENLLDAEGNAVYGEWEGGLIGVLNKQMEDFNDFNRKWYIEDSIKKEE
ncbi:MULTISPECIES: hypothetical protein [Emticicia]|uniref:hypothetical protein n=1 Tax=Emticicia TaxID=312278 RepID=UPI00209E5860|nr:MULTISPECIES: hypothetical protein [Emticicia]UTA66818.1 hypothetical protein MB380_14525 [Emticicia sp. 21SJ11W-3]